MKSSLESSYYMGIIYRPTHRPASSHPITTFSLTSLSKSQQINNHENQNEKEEQQKIIHTHQNRKKVKQILRHYNPYIVRKECDLKRRKKNNKSREKNSVEIIQKGRDEFFQVKKLENIHDKEIVKQPLECFDDISINVPQIEAKVSRKNSPIKTENEVSRNKHLSAQPIFHHFPSKLFLTLSEKNRKSQSRQPTQKLNNYFFPSRRAKTEIIDPINLYQDKSMKLRPKSSQPRKKFSENTRIFNFDGTLQNYRISIPQRPKTADHRILGKYIERKKQIHYLSYDEIAKKCIKLKNKKEIEQRGVKIQPWQEDVQNKNSGDLFEISCSSIRVDSIEL